MAQVTTRIRLDFSAIGETRWHEYAIRFLFGGVITVIAGLLAQRYGPAFGGLFLAFPAIFPASLTLIEKHEKRKGERKGAAADAQAKRAAGSDAEGSAIGSIGLFVFAFLVWVFIPDHPAWLVLTGGDPGLANSGSSALASSSIPF